MRIDLLSFVIPPAAFVSSRFHLFYIFSCTLCILQEARVRVLRAKSRVDRKQEVAAGGIINAVPRILPAPCPPLYARLSGVREHEHSRLSPEKSRVRNCYNFGELNLPCYRPWLLENALT